MSPEKNSHCPNHPVKTLSFTGSKSMLQRLMTLIAMHPSEILIENYNPCADVLEMETALRSFGYHMEGTGAMRRLSFDPALYAESKHHYQFTASATAYRFWTGMLAATPGLCSEIHASPILIKRGIEPLINALQALGAELKVQGTTIRISGKQLTGGELSLASSYSSHFVSSLLLCAPGFQTPLTLKLSPDQVSMPYIRLTAEMLMHFGADICYSEQEIIVQPGKLNFPPHFRADADASTAAAFAVGAAILRQPLCLQINPAEGLFQADYRIFSILSELGVGLQYGTHHVTIIPKDLFGGCFDLSDCPDLMPVLAILGLFCDAPLTLCGIGRLKHKESDRFTGITKAFDLLGAIYEAGNDSICIHPLQQYPLPPKSCTLDTQQDHRLVMAFTWLKLAYPQIKLSETASVQKSCPEFFELLNSMLD